jgi:hypothetical protein
MVKASFLSFSIDDYFSVVLLGKRLSKPNLSVRKKDRHGQSLTSPNDTREQEGNQYYEQNKAKGFRNRHLLAVATFKTV